MQTSHSRVQQGFVLSRWLLALTLIGVMAFLALTIGPAYWDHGRVVEIVDTSLAEATDNRSDAVMAALSPAEFEGLATTTRRNIVRRLNERGLTFVQPEQIQVERGLNQEMVIMIRYADRRVLFANIDYVANFDYRTDGL